MESGNVPNDRGGGGGGRGGEKMKKNPRISLFGFLYQISPEHYPVQAAYDGRFIRNRIERLVELDNEKLKEIKKETRDRQPFAPFDREVNETLFICFMRMNDIKESFMHTLEVIELEEYEIRDRALWKLFLKSKNIDLNRAGSNMMTFREKLCDEIEIFRHKNRWIFAALLAMVIRQQLDSGTLQDPRERDMLRIIKRETVKILHQEKDANMAWWKLDAWMSSKPIEWIEDDAIIKKIIKLRNLIVNCMPEKWPPKKPTEQDGDCESICGQEGLCEEPEFELDDPETEFDDDNAAEAEANVDVDADADADADVTAAASATNPEDFEEPNEEQEGQADPDNSYLEPPLDLKEFDFDEPEHFFSELSQYPPEYDDYASEEFDSDSEEDSYDFDSYDDSESYSDSEFDPDANFIWYPDEIQSVSSIDMAREWPSNSNSAIRTENSEDFDSNIAKEDDDDDYDSWSISSSETEQQ